VLRRLVPVALLVASCRAAPPAAPEPLRIAVVGTVVTLDPVHSGWAVESRLIQQLADGLLEIDAHLQLRPALAESWEVLEGGRAYRLRLRPDATWGEGRPLRSADVVRSLTRLAAKDSPYGWVVVSDIEGAEAYREGRASDLPGLQAEGDRTVLIRLRAPSGRFLKLLASGVGRIFPGEGTKEQWAAGQVPGSGPFRIAAVQDATSGGARARRYRLLARQGAHDPAGVRAVEWDTYRSAADLARGMTGTPYDIAYVPPSVALDPDGGLAGLQPRSTYRFAFLSLYLDCQKAPLDRPEARRALVLAADRNVLLAPADGGPSVPGTLPEDAVLASDPARGAAEARRAGLDRARPTPLRIAYSEAAEYGDVSGWLRERLAPSLLPVGLAVEGVPTPDGAALDERFFARKDHGYVYGSTPELADPCLFFEPFRTGNLAYNWSWYSRPQVDEAYQECAGSASEAVQRESIRRARGLVAEDAPLLPLGPAVQRVFQSARVRGFTPSPLEGLGLRDVSLDLR
jgi:ABC-type transport system substrate-binding protein